MKEERMKILQMVEDGKISVEEAGKLLEALKADYEYEDYGEDFTDRMREFCQSAEEFLKNTGLRIGEFAKDMEPKLRKVSIAIVAKTAEIIDDLAHALEKCLNFLDGDGECDCDCECCRDDEQDEPAQEQPTQEQPKQEEPVNNEPATEEPKPESPKKGKKN